MSINLTDELLAKTKKSKIASAKQVFLEGDQENLQQIGDKTHQLEDAIKDITVTGGASTANAVSYNNSTSKLEAITAQGAIDKLAAKNATKAEKAEVTAELEKKFDKESILQESGDAEDKVMSQKATTTAIEVEKNRAEAAEQAIIFDVSSHNNGAVFESLSALLSSHNLSTLIPTSARHGGMSIRFIQSSDNKYVKYFLPKNEWSIDPNDWEKVNLEKEVNQLGQSDSMMFNRLSLGTQYESYYWGVINSAGIWVNIDSNHQYRLFPVKLGDTISLTAGDGIGNYAFLNSIPFPAEGKSADLVIGTVRINVAIKTTVTVTAPADGYLYVSYLYLNSSTAFTSIVINNIDVTKDWNYVVDKAAQVPILSSNISKVISELDDIGAFRMSQSGTPSGLLLETPLKKAGKVKITLDYSSGTYKGNFRAYNGETLLGTYNLSKGANDLTLPSNTNRTIWYIGTSSTAVNPSIVIHDKEGILFGYLSELGNAIQQRQTLADADAQAKALKQYVLRFNGDEGGGNPIDKIPAGTYEVAISVQSGTLAAKLNGYDTNETLVFSKTIEVTDSFGVPDCDHMKVSLVSGNTAIGIVIRFTSEGSVLFNDGIEHNVPPYVFTINNGLRIPVMIYQEGIDKKASDITVNGGVGMMFNPLQGTKKRILTIENKNSKQIFTVKQIAKTPTTNVGGVKLLCLGDSLTAGQCNNPLTNSYDAWRNWHSYMTYISLIHNKDNNCGVITQVGTKSHSVNFEYNKETFKSKTFYEAISGWSATDFLHHPFIIKVNVKSNDKFSLPEAWYLLGLATKTPYDAEGYNVEYEDWEGTDSQRKLLYTTPMGRYKIDHTEEIWKKIQVKDSTFHPSEDWAGSAQQKSDVDVWVLAKETNPENPFYSLAITREYTGSHIWTNDKAMSLALYLERYRTMDDSGNRLYFDANGSTTGMAGSGNIGYLADGTPTTFYLGTMVSNTMAYNVCKPTHVIVSLGTNGGGLPDEIANIEIILNMMLTWAGKTGYHIPRFDNGVFNSGRWRGVVPTEIKENMVNYETNKYFMDKYQGNINNSSLIQYIPAYATQCPYSSVLDTYAIDDLGNKTYCQSDADGHIGWLAQRDIGLQSYGWLLHTLNK